MRIVFTGGGTMGPVSPLLAEIDYLLSHQNCVPGDFLWIGTEDGQERDVVEKYNIRFRSISAGKFRRYFAWKNFTDPLRIATGYFEAINVLSKFKADIVVSAGAYVSVPVAYAAKTLGIPVLIHQLDLQPGLANKLMSRVADQITVSWPDLVDDFPLKKTEWIGTPIRKYILEPIKTTLTLELKIKPDLPLVLVMGGGTGAKDLNMLVTQSLHKLLHKYQVVHLTGKGKAIQVEVEPAYADRYTQYEFVYEDLGHLMHQADLIVSRAGIGTISELLTIRKPAVIIPIPKSHQEVNADYFAQRGAIRKLDQNQLTSKKLYEHIDTLLSTPKDLRRMVENSQLIVKKDANKLMAQHITKLIK